MTNMNTNVPMPDVAIQQPGMTEPTNKVAAAGTAAAGIGFVVAGVMAGYGGPAIIELMGTWGEMHPNSANLIVMIVTGIAGAVAGKFGSQAAAYNVLDKPNVALVPRSMLSDAISSSIENRMTGQE